MKTVCLVSGGMDSAVLMARMLDRGHSVKGLSIFYGQRHARELKAAEALCHRYHIEHRIADLSPLRELLASSALTDPSIEVPMGHYEAESMKLTVVPNRNMIFLSVAIGWAVSMQADEVCFAAHAGDHQIYPDCRPEFVERMNYVTHEANWHHVEVLAPFLYLTKAQIADMGDRLGVPFELTWSCYKGGKIHCGVCSTCAERREAFHLAKLTDPTEYEVSLEKSFEVAGITA